MKNTKDTIGWGSVKINYVIMTDAEGVKWNVPTHINGEKCEYLTKHDPSFGAGTFERITINESTDLPN